jgi:hypothetical protein
MGCDYALSTELALLWRRQQRAVRWNTLSTTRGSALTLCCGHAQMLRADRDVSPRQKECIRSRVVRRVRALRACRRFPSEIDPGPALVPRLGDARRPRQETQFGFDPLNFNALASISRLLRHRTSIPLRGVPRSLPPRPKNIRGRVRS